eukprot:scaffold41278_cov24-Tisochrysis_lutea.AAC.4
MAPAEGCHFLHRVLYRGGGGCSCAAAGRGTAANWYRGQHPLQTVRDTLEACSVLGKGHERCVAIHG